MPLRVVVDRDEERKFKRRALRRMPLEYMEMLYGRVEGDTAIICAFVEIEHEATPKQVIYDWEDIAREQKRAASSGLIVLGSIHSHPFLEDSFFSEADGRISLASDEILFGICGISCPPGKRRQCYIDYWPQVKPLEVERRYVSSTLRQDAAARRWSAVKAQKDDSGPPIEGSQE